MIAHAERVALVTGCTRGLGRALVGQFVKMGYVVAGCGRSPGAVEELGRELGGNHCFEVVDVADDAAVGRFAQTVLDRLGAPHLLVNNAALINANAPLWEVPAEEFSRVIDVNLKGIAATVRHFVPAMIAAGRGVIVNFSSGWGRSTSPEVAPYCATKWGVEGLSQALAQELPAGLAAVALNPGIIDTEMLRSCFGAAAAGYPTAGQWADRAAPFIAALGPGDNGKALTAP